MGNYLDDLLYTVGGLSTPEKYDHFLIIHPLRLHQLFITVD